MTITTEAGNQTVTWFVILWPAFLLIAILAKSVLANMASIILSVMGFTFATQIAGVNQTVQFAVAALFILAIAFCFWQMLYRVQRL